MGSRSGEDAAVRVAAPLAVPIAVLVAVLGTAVAAMAADMGADVTPLMPPFVAMAPLDADGAIVVGGLSETAQACGRCHHAEQAEWATSRHRVSATNALFLDGFAAEPHPRCVYCHAPLATQTRALLRARPAIVARDAGAIARLMPPEVSPPSSSVHAGISCATCHVRDGAVVATRASRGYAHDVVVAPGLSDPRFCATCHEFAAHEVVDGQTVLRADVPLQTTFSEWQGYRDAGGQGTCQSCHMPVVGEGRDAHRSHAFVAGAHDVAALRAALSVRQLDGAIEVSSRGVGHAFPSGDLFRHLVVSVDGEEIARFGKRFAVTVGEDGLPHQDCVANTSLQPGEVRRVPVPPSSSSSSPRTLTITYHYADDAHEARGDLSYELLVVELVRMTVP